MESSKEPVSVRLARLNNEITSKSKYVDRPSILHRESLLDALQVLYDECATEYLQKQDQTIADFVKRYQDAIKEIKQLRINITDFEIKNIIGCGHFGEVHVVKEKQTGDVYAMKTIRKFDNDTSRVSFEEERNIMAFSNSPWLTSLQYAFQDSSYLFFVMDYHPGGDLFGLLCREGGTLSEIAAVFYLAELFLALEDLHKMGYVHRDIKPDNILIDRCGHLKLADFGSAAKLDQHGLVKAGPPVGTPDYIAPEVLQCLEDANDASSSYGVSCDFWSMGVLAYEIVIGQRPFQGNTDTALYSKIINQPKDLKFPSDILLTQAYVSFIKKLITNASSRLNKNQIKSHVVFKGINFDTLSDQVPPYVPQIHSFEDTSNFTDVQARKRHLSIENFKKRSQFSGRNLPFIGFTFTHTSNNAFETNFHRGSTNNNEAVQNMKYELDILRMKVSKSGDFNQEKENLEKKIEQKSIKLESLEALRDKLEKQVVKVIAENNALKRMLEVEHKERVELENRAVGLIRDAKMKWEASLKSNESMLSLELAQQKEKIIRLTNTNKTLEEQLQRAQKSEEKNRQSLETVQNLTRRSVINLETRLEKITSESQESIIELERKLSEERRTTHQLENQISYLEDKELRLSEKLKESARNYNQLKTQIEEAETIIRDLSERVNDLEQDLEQNENCRTQMEILQTSYDDSQKLIKDLQNQNVLLQNENRTIESYKKEVDCLKRTILKLQENDKSELLNKELAKEKEKTESLNKRITDLENSAVKPQELRDKQLQFWKVEKELSNCKIDKRILERELRDAKDEIKDLKDKLGKSENKFNEFKKCQEAALLELSNINENISMELVKSREKAKVLQEQLQNKKEKIDNERTAKNEIRGIIKIKDENIKTLESNLVSVKEEVRTLEIRCQKYEKEKTKMVESVEQLRKEKLLLVDQNEKGKREANNLNLNLSALREACVLLENQVVEYEKLVESAKKNDSELKANIEKLISDLCQARLETQEAKKNVNEQKSLRAVADQKIKRLVEDKACFEKECSDYKLQCMEYKQYSVGLSDQLTVSDGKLADAQAEATAFERQVNKLSSENKLLKEEISECLTNINKLKESNYKLGHQIDDLKKNNMGLVNRIEELEGILTEKNNYYKERELKADLTIKQQTKLIDYLLPMTNQKKKSSKKENQHPISLALNYKDLQTELTKERENNKKLKEEVYKLKAATVSEFNSSVLDKVSKMSKTNSEILSPRSKEAVNKLVLPPDMEKRDINRHNSFQRMHHNIPHRFDSKICAGVVKCVHCSNQIILGKNYHICKECKVSAHITCSGFLPKACGLPKEYIKHFTNTLEKSAVLGNGKTSEKLPALDAIYEGWVKMPCLKTTSWKKRYAYLTESSLDIYNDLGSTLIESLNLKAENGCGKIILEPLSSEIGIPIAASDIPFIIKVEIGPNTTCWPSKCIVIMALSAKEKDCWFEALQSCIPVKEENTKLEVVIKLPEECVVNCLVELTDSMKVLGTDKGFYAYYENKFFQIHGVNKLEQIAIFSPGNVVLMIAGFKSELISCDVNHLINLIQCGTGMKPTLKYKHVNVKNLNGFHLLQVSNHSQKMHIAVVTTKQLIILEYSFDSSTFIPVSILDTAQPTSCLLFTENSLIVGADKFFEIDLNSLNAEEFLDVSDIKLKQVLKCYHMGSFPVNVVQISSNPKEYLVSFNEFSVFVDEYGRSSRQLELKSSHIPLGIQFVKGYLYTVQFAAIEVVKITDETCNAESAEPYRMELLKFRYVGCNSKGIFLQKDCQILFLNARNLPEFDTSLVSTDNDSIGESGTNGSRFSFTSSIVQSLDGNLSDSTTSSEKYNTIRKKVTFNQTDL